MMSNSGDVQAQAQTPATEAPAMQPEAAAKAEKKHKAPAHPPYFQMIKEAITALNEKGGSSPYAIAKYIEQKYQSVLPGNFRKILGLQLKNSVAKGNLIKIKASYKLSAAARRDKVPKTTTKSARANAGKPSEMKKKKKKKLPKMKSVNTMTVAKAAAQRTKKPAKLKQLKKIKSPAVRKANKASAA